MKLKVNRDSPTPIAQQIETVLAPGSQHMVLAEAAVYPQFVAWRRPITLAVMP